MPEKERKKERKKRLIKAKKKEKLIVPASVQSRVKACLLNSDFQSREEDFDPLRICAALFGIL